MRQLSLNEAETRAELIDPRLRELGWSPGAGTLRLERTPGPIYRHEGQWDRGEGRLDYLLCVRLSPEAEPVPVAVIEAKREGLPADLGLEQGRRYAKRFNVPFAFATNGHMWVRYDDARKVVTNPLPMTSFPSHDTLLQQYQTARQIDLRAPAARALLTPYDLGGYEPRYYQDAAVRAVLEAIAQGRNRALISLATGAGKTFLAVQLIKRLADAGQVRKALFVCDRTELRDQAHGAFHNVFGDDAQRVSTRSPAHNARILFATYQTLDAGDDDEASFLIANYPPDTFSHIIIDECHRSAWGKWSEVLERNSAAVQIGLTATPRTLRVQPDSSDARADLETTADNIRYFGEPVYEYTLTQANEDGYLAVAEVARFRIDVDERGLSREELQRLRLIDARKGAPLTGDELAFKGDVTRRMYEHQLQLPERTEEMAAHLFARLLEVGRGDPCQKTIIFCVEDHHCDAVTAALTNLYAGWCARNGRTPVDYFAFKCTAAGDGHDYLADLRASRVSHFIATTVRLLDAGIDVPAVQNIAFFVYLNSPIAFYQMLGRGTRLYESKLFFRIFDYTDATRLLGEAFETAAPAPGPDGYDAGQGEGEGGVLKEPGERRQIVRVEGLGAVIIDRDRDGVVAQRDGRDTLIPTAEYQAQIAARLRDDAPTFDDLRARWVAPPERQRLLERLAAAGYSPHVLRELKRMYAYDLFDVLAEAAYRRRPLTREERARAFDAANAAWLAGMPAPAAATLRAVLAAFVADGTRALEHPELLDTPAVRAAGGRRALAAYDAAVFGEAKTRVFAV
ncbi:MAG: DEAD/DEAH box helicase family protein [Anaerolineae bacterium]|nr:DEAD/DEAH box helicase family protein [Anaerolineae bacterium]